MQLTFGYLTVLTSYASIAEAAPNGSAAQSASTAPAPVLQGAGTNVPVHTAAEQQVPFQTNARHPALLQGTWQTGNAGSADSLVPNGKDGRHGHKPPLYPAKRVHTGGRQQRQQMRSRMQTEPQLSVKYTPGAKILWLRICLCSLPGHV